MKKSFIYIAAAALGLSTALTSCDDNFVHPPLILPPVVHDVPNATMAEVKADYWSSLSAPVTIPYFENGDTLKFTGRVCSSDETGNVYKNIVIQSVDANGEQIAMTFSVNEYDIYQQFPFGQEVIVYASGLSIGGYSGLLQFGAISGNSMTFMDGTLFQAHVCRNNSALPEPAKVDTTLATIPELVAAKANQADVMRWQSRLIRFENVSWVEAGQAYAPSATVTRYIVDTDGNRFPVRNSSYSSFKNELMPYGVGNVTGILSYFGSDWQLVLIDAEGSSGFDGEAPEPGEEVEPAGEGTAESPYNVAKALEVATALSSSEQVAAYVKGKVVSISEFSTSFGNATYTIGDNATGRTLQVYRGNGLDGAKFTSEDQLAVGAEVVIYGDLVNYMGNTPQFTTGSKIVSYNGQGGSTTPDTPGVEEGDGTAASPYNVSKALAVAKALSDTGEAEAYAKGTVASITELSTSFGNATYTITDGSASLQVYRGYGLDGAKFTSEDELVVGAEVVVHGTLVNFKGNTPQFTTGSTIVSYNGQGGTTTPDTPADGVLFTETFTSSLGNFTINNVTLPEGLDYVWNWGGASYGAKASAYTTQAFAAESWLVSPVIDLSGATGCELDFDHAAKFQTTLKTLCGVYAREEGASDWTALTISVWPTAGSWDFTNSGKISLAAFNGKKIQVAFKYGSSASGADTWEIKNFNVYGNK